MAYQIEYAYTCHMGKVRTNNEDNFWCCGDTLTAENQGFQEIKTEVSSSAEFPLLAVFDGMGGESCGEIAAFLAAQTLGTCYKENKQILKENQEQFLEQTCRWMNRAVCEYAMENRIGCMGTTVAFLSFGEDQVMIGNLGDSRIYKAFPGGFQQLSTDHVLWGTLYRKAPLTQYLGIPDENMELDPSLVREEYCENARYLLCSDGLTDMLSDGEIADILSRELSVKDTVEILRDRALLKGGRDNVTVVLCEIQAAQKGGSCIRQWLEGKKCMQKWKKLFFQVGKGQTGEET